MSRGRKPKINDTILNWQQFFNRNVGSYLQIISIELSALKTKKAETPFELLKKIENEKNQLLSDRKLRLNSANPKAQITELRYEIPNNWNWFLLSDVAFYQEGPGIRTFQYRTEGIKLLNVTNITQDKLRLDLTTRYIALEEYEQKYKHFKIEEGDILFASSGGSWGKTCWFENSEEDLILNTSTMRIKSFSEKILLNKYLYLFLKTDFFRNQLIPQLMGMQPNFGSTHFNSVSIPVPPVEDQYKILSFLEDFENNNLKAHKYYFNSAVEEKIITLHKSQLTGSDISLELKHQLNLVKKLRQQLIQDAVTGKLIPQNQKDESAKKLLQEIIGGKNKLIKDKKIKKEKELPAITPDEIPFSIPKNWDWCRLGNICTKIGSGSTPNGSNYATNGRPFFRSQNIYDAGLVYDDIKFINNEVHKQMNGTIVYPNDILLNITGGSMGRCALVPNDFEEGNVSQHVCIIRPLLVNTEFYHFLIQSPFFQKNIFSSTTGAGREGLPKYNLEQFLIPLPPLAEQGRIVKTLKKLMLICDELNSNIQQSVSQNTELLVQVLKESMKPKKELPSHLPFILEENHFIKRKVLATYIINQSLADTKFGDVKFEKLLHLSDYFAIKRNLGQKYFQQAAGPYDNAFTNAYFNQIKSAKWFNRTKNGRQFVFSPAQNHDKSKNTYDYFSNEEFNRVNEIITYFKKYDYEQPEIVSTLYAVWNNRIISKKEIKDDLLISDFYAWDKQKKKYDVPRLKKALQWMRDNQLIPDGWGKVIEKSIKKERKKLLIVKG